MIRPMSNQVLLRVIPADTQSAGGIAFPEYTLTPEDHQERSKTPTPPPPIKAKVLAIGPWPKLKNGMIKPPPFPPDSTVLIRNGAGIKLAYGTDDKLRIVESEEILGVFEEIP